MPIIPAFWEAEVGGLPEVRSLRSAWPTWQDLISTKNTKISRVWWQRLIVPLTQEAETEGSWEVEAAVGCHCITVLQPG